MCATCNQHTQAQGRRGRKKIKKKERERKNVKQHATNKAY